MSEKLINVNNLLSNVEYLKKKSGCKKFCAVVKANAYGHGIENIVPILKDYVNYFAVATFNEALQVKSIEKNVPILVLSPEIQPKIEKGIELAVASEQDVLKLENQKKNVFVHLKLNSGMNRFGLNVAGAKKVLSLIKTCKFVKLKGVFTHFHSAENKKLLNAQNANFRKMLSQLDLPENIIIHASNSQAALAGVCCDMCRCGIGIYGFGNKNLKPVLEIKSKLVCVREVEKGDFVGYSGGFVAPKKMKVGTIKIGYADGFLREFNFGSVSVLNKKCKILGNICMDCLFCDLTNAKNAKIGDDVKVLWSGNSVEKISKKTKKITYEILCGFNNLR